MFSGIIHDLYCIEFGLHDLIVLYNLYGLFEDMCEKVLKSCSAAGYSSQRDSVQA